jgi:hypothetical protein
LFLAAAAGIALPVRSMGYKMRGWLTTVLLLAVLGASISKPQALGLVKSGQAISQTQGLDERRQRQRPQEPTSNVDAENRKIQALSILHEIIDRADPVDNLELQASLLSSALDLVWKHDIPRARSDFQKTLDRFFGEYSSNTNTKQRRNQAASGIKSLASSLAKHDPAAASEALDRYTKITEQLPGNTQNLSLKDQLAVAQSSLAVDTKQSAMLATQLLRTGVPLGLADYLYKLEVQDSDSATNVFKVALSYLAASASYSPNHATILSAYAFRENLLVFQMRANHPATSTQIEYGSLTVNLSPTQKPFSLQLGKTYLNAAYRFLEQRLFVLQQQKELDPEYLIQCYFLARKLNGYATKLNIDNNRRWEQLSKYYEVLGQRAGLTRSDLDGLAELAERLVAEGSIFEFDDGASAFEKAKTSKNAKEKTEMLVRGIHELLEAEKFAEAEGQIRAIEDEAVIEPITDYFHFRAGKTAVQNRKWNDLSYHSNKIAQPQLRTFLFLAGTKAALKYGKRDFASDYLQSAISAIPKIEDKSSKAKALIAVNGFVVSLDSNSSSQTLFDAIKAINQADNYDGRDYLVTIELTKLKLLFPLKESDINNCFERSAQTDWANTISAANNINRGEIRAMAQIAACRGVL